MYPHSACDIRCLWRSLPCDRGRVGSVYRTVVVVDKCDSTGIWMRIENRRRNKAQGLEENYSAANTNTEELGAGRHSPSFRYTY